MLRLGGVASNTYLVAFPAIREHFQRQGLDLDWVLYSNWDALVDAFISREIDLAWNGPLAYPSTTSANQAHRPIKETSSNESRMVSTKPALCLGQPWSGWS